MLIPEMEGRFKRHLLSTFLHGYIYCITGHNLCVWRVWLWQKNIAIVFIINNRKTARGGIEGKEVVSHEETSGTRNEEGGVKVRVWSGNAQKGVGRRRDREKSE
jgi:hypothetical protein